MKSKYLGHREENILRAVGVSLGIALVGFWLVTTLPTYPWWDPRHYLDPGAWMYTWTAAMAGGFMARQQLNFGDKSRLSKSLAVFVLFTAISHTLAEQIATPLMGYGLPGMALLILGAIIFFVSFDMKSAKWR